MGVGAGLYMCDVVVKSSRSLSHLLKSSCYLLYCTTILCCKSVIYAEISADASRMRIMLFIYHHLYLRLNLLIDRVERSHVLGTFKMDPGLNFIVGLHFSLFFVFGSVR